MISLENEYNSITPDMVEAEYALLMDKVSKSANPEYDKTYCDNQIIAQDKYNAENWSHRGEQYALWSKWTIIRSMSNDTYGLRD